MTTRNVDLLIQARDNASKAFRDVGKALDELLKIQEGVAASGSKLDRSLEESKGAATALSRTIGSQTAREAQKAEAVFKRIETTVDENTRSVDRLGKELREAEEAYAALRRQAEAASQAQQRAAARFSRTGQASDRQQLEAVIQAREELNREIARAEPLVAKQRRELQLEEAQLDRLVRSANAAALALREVQTTSARAAGAADTRATQQQANLNARRGIAELAKAEQEVAKRIADRERATERAAEEYRQGTQNAATGMERLAQAERRVAAEVRRRQAAQANANARTGFGGLAEAEDRIARSLRNSATAAAASDRAYALLNARLEALRAAARPSAEQQEKLAQGFRRALNAGRAYQPSLRQIARELAGLGPASAQAADGVRRVSAEMFNARRAFRAFYGDSRRALSLMQRIRGEVLSLTASFVGFYGIFQTGRGFLESFQQLEAAQNRLGAAFDQDYGKVQEELGYLRSEADRLGISFNTLSDTYSKFLISGQQAGLEVEQLRDIFRQVSESGRVLKLSNDQLNGVFTALTQIAGKGTLQMEELRQQLGDRLPGAVGIVAKALGYAEGELADFYKAVENGQVGAEEALVALGKGLEETYGGQLEQSLDSVSAKIGQLQNLFFQRQITAANSGFIEGIEEAIDALSGFLESREGIEFFEALGQAFQRLVGVLPVLLENLDLIVAALQAFVAIKVGQVVSGFAANLTTLFRTTVANQRVQVALNAAVRAFSPAAASAMASATRLGAVMRGVRAATAGLIVTLRAAFAAIGGIVGIAAAALSFFAFEALADVGTQSQEVREQIRQMEDVVGLVGKAYREAAGDVEKFNRSLENIPVVDLKVRLREAKAALAELREGLQADNLFRADGLFEQFNDAVFDTGNQDLLIRFLKLRDAFEAGEIGARELVDGIRDLGDEFDVLASIDPLGPLLESLDEAASAEDLIEKLEAQIAVLEGTATEAQRELLGLKEEIEETGDEADQATARMDGFVAAMRELGENVPEINEQLKRLDAIKQIEEDFQAAIDAANEFPDAIERAARKNEALRLRNRALRGVYDEAVSGYGGSEAVGVTADFLRDREGFRETPYWDVNAFRVGYGSDTITLADGTIQKVTEGMRVSIEDANRDLYRRIETEFLPAARAQVGAERFDSFNPQQQAALTSIAYNYGSLPDRILGAVRTGTDEQIASAIRSLAGDNGGVNAERRGLEAALFTSSVGREGQEQEFDRSLEERRRIAEKEAEQQREYLESQRQRLENAEFELSLENKRLVDAEVAKAIRDEELKAQKVGLELTEEQRAEIERVTRAKYAQAQAEEDRNKALEKARALEEEVNLLQEKRQLLIDRQIAQEGQGDMVGAARTAEELEEVETRLDSAIQKAIQFWESLGGEGSERAVIALQRTQQEIDKTESKILTTGEQMNKLIADRLSGAISEFAQAIAQGKAGWEDFANFFLKAAAEILIQIGQMIVQQALFNALSGGTPNGGAGGFISNAINGLFRHSGGLVNGSGMSARSFNPAIFANAARFHTGGVAGLGPDEMPAILKRNEEVLTEGDPRHRFNGGLGGGAADPATIINAFDAPGFMDAALAAAKGKRTFLNFVRANGREIKAALDS